MMPNMTAALTGAGFNISDTDPCLFTKTMQGNTVYVIVHVDDLLVIGTTAAAMTAKTQITQLFDVKVLGAAKVFLGLEIRRDRPNKKLWLGQTKYIEDMLIKYGMDNSNSRVAPLDAGTRLDDTGELLDAGTPYRGLVGTLLYLVN